MSRSADNYDFYYADKLWQLLPVVYRAEDTDQYRANGPLRELVNRIGAQAAIVRRSIDRMWEDQSIETCDDWVVAYLADLLHTNLVPGLEPSRQRLDVAKTIHYRRRKGTLAILEEIAADITGWEAKAVEFFRRLGRTRHGLDPPIGRPLSPDDDIARLQSAEGLTGKLTRTGIGGFADLRNVYGASKADSAFDEFFHTADFRPGRGSTGWYNIPALGMFLWRLKSFALGPATPVHVDGCSGWFTFDPTGRDAPLFAAARGVNAFGDQWVSPTEEQMPGPISQPLLDANRAAAAPPVRLYPNALAVFASLGPDATPVPADELLIRPARGRFASIASPPLADPRVIYHYGFSSEIGAGPYDRRVGGVSIPTPGPATSVSRGGDVLTRAASVPTPGTLILSDSLTYSGIADLKLTGDLTLAAGIQQRPLIRLDPGKAWMITGQPGVNLTLDGLFVSGGDIVLSGSFASVTLNCCTFDPGTEAAETAQLGSPPAELFAIAADGRPLVPTTIWIEASIGSFTARRCILGPLRTLLGGFVETVTISETILQAIPTGDTSPPAVGAAAELALEFADGVLNLSRCTVMGGIVTHRFTASECILREHAEVDDTQDGCIRFTAWADGSVLPRKYESVRIPQSAPLFTTTDFGQPGYGQLLPSVDAVIMADPGSSGTAPNTISAGAEDESEMGAFAREKNPIKERGLLLKFLEYMPAGLVSVLIPVT
jgi:hypothetical protein